MNKFNPWWVEGTIKLIPALLVCLLFVIFFCCYFVTSLIFSRTWHLSEMIRAINKGEEVDEDFFLEWIGGTVFV